MKARYAATFAVALALVVVCADASAQNPNDPVAKLIKDFQAPTTPNMRVLSATSLVSKAVEQLKGNIREGETSVVTALVELLLTPDKNVAANAAFALGQIGNAIDKTETQSLATLRKAAGLKLRMMLEDQSFQVRYACTEAIGAIWAGNRGGDDECLQVNGRLYGIALSSSSLPEVYISILALTQINDDFKVDLSKFPDYALQDKQTEQVMDKILGDWRQALVDGRQNKQIAIPDLNKLDWRGLVLFIITGEPGERARARDELITRGNLDPLEYILSKLQEERLRNEALPDLCEVVTRLTNAALQIEKGTARKERVELVDKWRVKFMQKLREMPREKAMPYVVAQIGALLADPLTAAGGQAEQLQEVLPWHVDDKAQVPEQLPEDMKNRLLKELELKDVIRGAVRDIQQSKGTDEANMTKRVEATRLLIDRVMKNADSRRIMRIFLKDFCQSLITEQHNVVRDNLQKIVEFAAQSPIPLSSEDKEEVRRDKVMKWLGEIGEEPLP
ncbi:MAG TPA: HEAT repeat domain-containing protein [Candidatus Brocadiia bacterium]|nr:HEAT repeat domain-containing protein [Candidatus Brocadiia bacterium]